MISGERKKFGLKQSRKPHGATKGGLLGYTALVHTSTETGYCYIGFDTAFEDFVAKELPRGLAAFDPAYIQVTERGDVWEVQANYINDGTHAVLWRTTDKPSWIGKLRKEKADGGIAETEAV